MALIAQIVPLFSARRAIESVPVKQGVCSRVSFMQIQMIYEMISTPSKGTWNVRRANIDSSQWLTL